MIGVNDYKWPNAACGGCCDPWGCGYRQCTSLVAQRVNLDFGVPFFPGQDGWGNANNWANAARAHGWPVSGTPHRLAVAQFNPGVQGALGDGHVALVLAVGPTSAYGVWVAAGSILIEDYDFCAPACCEYHRHVVGVRGVNFITFILPPSPPPPPVSSLLVGGAFKPGTKEFHWVGVIADGSGRVFHNWRDDVFSGPEHYEDLGGVAAGRPECSWSAPYDGVHKLFAVKVRGTNGHDFVRVYDEASGGWSAWIQTGAVDAAG